MLWEADIATQIVINGRFLAQQVTGVQRYARELVAALDLLLVDRPDLQVQLLTPNLVPENIPTLSHIEHRCVGRLQGHAWEQMELPHHVGSATLFCPGNTAPIYSLLRSPVVVTVHDLSYLYFPDAYSRSFRLLYNCLTPLILHKASRVITVSQSERSSILRHYPFAARRLVAIQNGGLPTGIERQSPSPSTLPIVLYVGSLSKRKNFPGMLEVAIRLARERNVQIQFVGGVPQGLNASLAAVPLDLHDRIHFRGQINDWGALVDAYRSAACFLFPSFYEASPLPPIEAMGCGCPVVAGDIPSLQERCGDAAIYCDPANVDDIAGAVERILDDGALANSLRGKGYARADAFSWKTCARATLDVILGAGGPL